MPVFEVRQVVMCAAGEWRLHAKRVAVVRELAESDPRLIARAMTLPPTLPDQSFTNLARLGCPISAHDESCPEKPSLYNFILVTIQLYFISTVDVSEAQKVVPMIGANGGWVDASGIAHGAADAWAVDIRPPGNK